MVLKLMRGLDLEKLLWRGTQSFRNSSELFQSPDYSMDYLLFLTEELSKPRLPAQVQV